MTMKRFKIYCEISASRSVVKRAINVALIVGTALNIINQGEVLLGLELANVNFIKLSLTYVVPYSVTTYTAVAMKLEFQIGTKAVATVDLKCHGCKKTVHINEGEIIPECDKCGIKTHWRLA